MVCPPTTRHHAPTQLPQFPPTPAPSISSYPYPPPPPPLGPQAADRRKEVEVLKKRQDVEEGEMKQRRGGVEAELSSR